MADGDHLIGELMGRVSGVEREVGDTRERLVAAESRLTLAIDRLIDRLDKSNREMTAAIENMANGVTTRVGSLEKDASNTRLLARLAFSLLPLVGGAFLWFETQTLNFSDQEVLLLKQQAQDLIEHRRQGGLGDNWIHPSRRRYGREPEGTLRGS